MLTRAAAGVLCAALAVWALIALALYTVRDACPTACPCALTP